MRCHATAREAAGQARSIIILILLSACLLAALPAALFAQGRDVATTAVITFRDRSGRQSRLLEEKATDAVVLALADCKEFLVTPAADVERELRALALTPPLSITQAVRLGRRMDVTSVTTGEILQATVNQATGSAAVRLQIQMVDVAAEEVLDGAVAAMTTPSRPGWQGTEADILNEALRQAAEQTVARMLATRVRRGTIEAVVSSGNCEINLGAQDGVKPGMKMVVMRPLYIRDLEKVVLRNIGRVEVAEAQADICYATPHANVAPRTGDLVLRVYEPESQMIKLQAKKRGKDFLIVAVAAALGAAIVSIAAGGNVNSPGAAIISYLNQSGMGATSVIRVQYTRPDKANGHLLFRGEYAGFPPDAPYLVEVSAPPNGEETLSFMDDVPQSIAQQSRTITVAFVDESGEWATETVDVTWTHPALAQGQPYFHRIRRVTKPKLPPGSNPPVATGGNHIAQDPTNVITQSSQFPMISQPTNLAGPVTYIIPSQLVLPPVSGPPQNPNGPIDFEWAPTLGADDYMLELFPVTDPSGLGQPAYRRTGIRPVGSGNITFSLTPVPGDLAPNSVYFWRVGARNSLEATDRPKGQGIPRVGFGQNTIRGYVLSEMRSFQTAPSPPPTPLTRKGGKRILPVAPGGEPGGGGTPPKRNPRGKGAGTGRPHRVINPQPVGPRPTR